jgi:hypothetical protein
LEIANFTLQLLDLCLLAGGCAGLLTGIDQVLVHPTTKRLHPDPTFGPIALHARYTDPYSAR